MGYLGLTQLLDESTEILMLVTNSIKNDINNPNQFISGTALCALGTIGNQEMCMALSREVQMQLSVDNPMIRKKAALCAMRIIKKVDDIEDKFNSRVTSLLEDKNHGVILSACSLLIHLVESNPAEYIPQFKHCPQILIKTLKMMLMSGYTNAAEYDFGGIVDPFIQVKILRLIRLFSSQISNDELNDVLAQIATNTDSSKNAGNAVLYECVQTIMSIKSAENGLRVLGINILGKFLTNKDNNIRYVGLQMLQKVVGIDPKAVQRHRSTVLECLKDNDISIRRRALEVAFALVNTENIQSIVKEMISYIPRIAENDEGFKSDLASRVCMLIDKFAPDKKWHIDNTIRVLLLAGNDVNDEVVYSLCHVVAGSPELHAYAVTKLFFILADPELDHPDSLVVVATWILGEYGHLLASSGVTLSDILDLFECVLRKALVSASDQAVVAKQQVAPVVSTGARSSVTVCEYVVTAMTKLLIKSSRASSMKGRVETILRRFDGSLFVDLQQRVCEFLEILSPSWDDATRAGLLDVMPPCEKSIAAQMIKAKPVGELDMKEAIPENAQSLIENVRSVAAGAAPTKAVRNFKLTGASGGNGSGGTKKVAAGFDLDDLLGDATVIPQQAQPTTSAAAPVPKVQTDDLLKDIFG